MAADVPQVPKFLYDELKAERDALILQSRSDAAKIRELEINLQHHTKLSSIVFARWIFQIFTEHILSEVDPELKTDRTTSRIQEAWSTFFGGQFENSKVAKALGKCDVLLPSFANITKHVQELRSRKLTRHRCKTMNEEVRHWVASRSSELYFKFSMYIHNLIQIKWFVDYEGLEMFLAALPDITDADKELITLLHILITDVIPSEILKEAADRLALFERTSS